MSPPTIGYTRLFIRLLMTIVAQLEHLIHLTRVAGEAFVEGHDDDAGLLLEEAASLARAVADKLAKLAEQRKPATIDALASPDLSEGLNLRA